ncbi:minor capsid protein [Pseudoflavonifractor sp. MSJ-37]|uniref:minor capsid protein n=1 Tax=Pseudoflavonifractor sp. MSJ-37 TaxID=2841531 RepID=UPI001C1084B7|nr:minor capsid protein [Pseudoflavonifractor sp. MSJ-37]MBU5435567.1 minor capsid protein [Pseudoflavonifractor sp. MSJ-37]
MNNADYWRGRFSILEDSAHREAQQTIQAMEEMYLDAQRSVQKEIESWYARFADNNQISLTDARKWLTAGQLEEFHWTVEQYIKIGEQAGLDAAWLKKLENASARFHISRLESVQMGIQQQLELLYGNQVDSLDALLKKVVGNGYTHTAFEVQKGVGLGWDITALNQKKLETLLSKPWTTDGRTFRDRCWLNKNDLVGSVSKSLTQGLLRGDSPAKITTAIQKQFGVHRYKAGRLVNTETTYFNAVATKESYKDLGVEMVEIIETLDSHTCSICGGLDGKVIPIAQYEPGVTVPPFHPNCRGTTAPAIDPKYAGERAARNEDGKVYYVPANMKYADWVQTFVNGGSKGGLTAATGAAIMKAKRALEILKPEMFPEYLTDKKELKNTKTLMDYINGCENADPDVVALYAKMGDMENIKANGIPMKVSHGKDHAVSYRYRLSNDHIIDAELTIPKLSGEDLTGQVVTTLHEEMHLMDMFNRADAAKYSNWFSSSNAKLSAFFQKTDTDIADDIDALFEAFDKECTCISREINSELRKTTDALYDQYLAGGISYTDYKKGFNKLKREASEQIDYQCRNAMGGGVSSLEDIYDALSGGSARDAGLVRYGHGTQYYRNIGKRSEETLANYGALAIVRPDLVDMLRKDKPELVDALDEVIQEMLKKAGG